jgi:hypothetical protein
MEHGSSCMVELTEGNRGRVCVVPSSGELNIDDVIEFETIVDREVMEPVEKEMLVEGAKKKVMVAELVKKKLDEPRREARKIISRKWVRRTACKTKPEQLVTFTAELAKRGLPFQQLEGCYVIVAHQRETLISDVSKAVGVKLLKADLDLQEPEDD